LQFNLDPVLIVVLVLLCAWQLRELSKQGATESRRCRRYALSGWLVAALALVSPLCALSVSLFSARMAQQMTLLILAAPLIARALPPARGLTPHLRQWGSGAMFFVCLWFWHMPVPYEATFTSPLSYWIMHITLCGSAVLLWRELLHHAPQDTAEILAIGALTFMHMGLLGAVLALADGPMFHWHLPATQAWRLTPLRDQQLGGTIMWVPGVALFLWSALRSLGRLWHSMDQARPA